MVSGKDCTISDAALFIMGGVLQHKLTLQPGEEKQIQMVFGVSESIEEARDIRKHFADAENVEQAFQQAVAHNMGKYASLSAHTPDDKINHIMNYWLKSRSTAASSVRRVSGITCRSQSLC